MKTKESVALNVWIIANIVGCGIYTKATPNRILEAAKSALSSGNLPKLAGIGKRLSRYWKRFNSWRIAEPTWLVFPAYSALAIGHGTMAYRNRESWMKGGKHAASALLAAYYALGMHIGWLHYGWHHMSYGLLALTPELAGLNLFGAAMAADEIYTYNELGLFAWKGATDGFDNVFVDNFSLFAAGLTLATVLELGYRHFQSKQIAKATTPGAIETH